VSNLIPRDINNSFFNILDAGDNLENDGKQIFFDLKIKDARIYLVEATKFIEDGELKLAIEKLKNLLTVVPHSPKILRSIVRISLYTKLYESAEFYLTELENTSELSANDLLQKGCLKSFQQNHDEAITIYGKVLKKDRNNVIALNNIGYELIEKGAHEVAKRALERAIKLRPSFDHPYNNLGYSKILQGEYKEGKSLVDKCLELNNENADAYKTLGIYYLKLKNLSLANFNFNKAIELDSETDLSVYVDELKLLTENEVNPLT
jgi:tetratricopeptide (TPR) repeat protein